MAFAGMLGQIQHCCRDDFEWYSVGSDEAEILPIPSAYKDLHRSTTGKHLLNSKKLLHYPKTSNSTVTARTTLGSSSGIDGPDTKTSSVAANTLEPPASPLVDMCSKSSTI